MNAVKSRQQGRSNLKDNLTETKATDQGTTNYRLKLHKVGLYWIAPRNALGINLPNSHPNINANDAFEFSF